MSRQNLTVSSDLSDEYYSIHESVSGPTVMDALIAACRAKYGSAFTAATADDYMDFAWSDTYSSYSVTKWFGQSTYNTAYYLNNTACSSSVDQTAVSDNDLVETIYLGDSYSDLYSCFDKNIYNVKAGSTFSMTLKADNWGTAVTPTAGAQISQVNSSTGALTAVSGKTTDSQGTVSMSFTRPGTYYISAAGSVTYTGWSGSATGNITAPWATVNVTLNTPAVKVSNKGIKSLKISWGKVTGASKYRIYRSAEKNSGFKKVKTTTARSWTNSSLTTGKRYYYKVRAVYGSYTSALSSVKSNRPRPAKAVITRLSRQGGNIVVKWKKVKNADGYMIYRAASKNGKYKKLKDTKAGTVYTSVHPGSKTFYYKVRAYKVYKGKKITGSFSAVKKVK